MNRRNGMQNQYVKVYKTTKKNPFSINCRLNGNVQVQGITASCERQCVHCNVNSQKLGYVRS